MNVFWTIENAGVEKTIAAWGIDDVNVVFVSQGEDVATLSQNGRKFDASHLFAYKSQVIIRRDRVGTATGTVFTGGSVYFTGLFVQPHVGGRGRREFQACSIVGPWWYLNERGFEQEYKEIASITEGVPTYVTPNPTRSRIFLNLELGEYGQLTINKLNTGEQLTEILNWALKPFVDTATAPPFQIGTIGIAVDAPVDEVKNITCAEAARKMFRWSPDCVSWFDYTTSPPTFHVKRRAALTAFNLDLTTLKPTSLSITPRFDLQRPYVKIQYEITDTVDGVTIQRTEEDVYPDPPPTGALNQFAGVPFVIDLRGYTRTTAPSVSIETVPINTSSADWWLLNFPEYAEALNPTDPADPSRVTNITFKFASVKIKAAGGAENLNLPNQLIGGPPSDAIDADFQHLTATIKASVTWADGSKAKDKTFAFQFTSTDAETGDYGGGGSFDEGDPQPVGLAQDFYEAVAHVPYEGSLTFRTAELGSLPKIGNVLNILGSANASWDTMATIVQRVTENIQGRTTTIEFGTPPHLDLGDLVALLRVARHRDPQNPYSIRVGGGGGGGGSSNLRKETPIQNNSTDDGNYERLVIKDGSKTIDHNAVLAKSVWSGPATCTIDLNDITGKAAQFREFHWLDRLDNCKEYKAWFLMTLPEEVVT